MSGGLGKQNLVIIISIASITCLAFFGLVIFYVYKKVRKPDDKSDENDLFISDPKRNLMTRPIGLPIPAIRVVPVQPQASKSPGTQLRRAQSQRLPRSVSQIARPRSMASDEESQSITSGPPGFVSSIEQQLPLDNESFVDYENDDIDSTVELAESCPCSVSEDVVLDPGVDQGLGQLHFALSYDYIERKLTITIVEAKELPVMDVWGSSDPYVNVTLLPDKRNKFTTSVKHKRLEPKWNECFVLQNFLSNQLEKHTLEFTVMDKDIATSDDHIGSIQFPLSHLYDEEVMEKTLTVWKYLRHNKYTKGFVGEMKVSICYNPDSSMLEIGCIQCKSLKPLHSSPTKSNTFCVAKVVNLDGNTSGHPRKTSVARQTNSPVWNDTLPFKVLPCEIHRISVNVLVLDKQRVGPAKKLARLKLGPRTGSVASRQWQQMLAKPREPVVNWHNLVKP